MAGNVLRSYGIPFDADAADVYFAEARDLGRWSQLAKFNISWSKAAEIRKEPIKFVVSRTEDRVGVWDVLEVAWSG